MIEYDKNKGRQIIFVRILFPYISGILISSSFASLTLFAWAATLGILVVIVLFLTNVFYLRLKGYRFKPLIYTFFFVFWCLAGAFAFLLHYQRIHPDHFSKIPCRYLKVQICDEPVWKNKVIRFKAEVQRGYFKAKGKIQNRNVCGILSITLSRAKLKNLYPIYGDQFIIQANIKEIAGPLNPGGFDYKTWLSLQQIDYQAFLRRADVIGIHRNSGNPILSFAIKLRAREVGFYRRVLSGKDHVALASTLILGYRSDLDQETLSVYSKTGTIHALSVSGMHVGMVYIVLNSLLGLLDKKNFFKILKVAILLLSVWFYALLTGLSPSVLRSVVMISIFIVAKSFGRKTNDYNILAFAAFCLLLYNPFLLWDVGFQLSFLAVLGLISIQPKIEECLTLDNKYSSKLWSAAAASLSAQIATFPLSIYYFHQFPVYFLLSNLFLMIPAALIMYTGIALLIFKLAFIAPIFEWLISFTNTGLRLISQMPYATISGIWIDKTMLLLLTATLAAFVIVSYFRQKQLLFVAFLLWLAFELTSTICHFKHLNQQRTITFRIRKTIVLACLHGESATLIAREKASEQDFEYFIRPGLDQSGIKSVCWKIVQFRNTAFNR